ncbi:hypothetical protein SAMN05518871_10127 [Psychrobacillus sp. OK028]|uniref:hypothetical protein n=1 Tax=Psychrobacillus sp. OK028 TaxID=1884359 RepID=UPI000882F9D5|nr:hypothetical protein SAMN05518871_10127 [Psychrobacillus sp. OK028]
MRKHDYAEQLWLPFVDVVKEEKHEPAKRVNVVSVKLVREKTMLYKNRRIRSPLDAYLLMKEFLSKVDLEHFVVL